MLLSVFVPVSVSVSVSRLSKLTSNAVMVCRQLSLSNLGLCLSKHATVTVLRCPHRCCCIQSKDMVTLLLHHMP